MPHLATVAPSQADGVVAATYTQIENAIGRVPAAFQLYSLSPELLRQQWEFLGYYLKHPALSGPWLAFLRLSISREIRCNYCIGLNGGLLINRYGWTAEQLAAAKQDLNSAPFNEKEKVLLRYCLDAVQNLGRVDPARLDALRQLGWTDRDIFDAVTHAARNVAADIIFNTFGLENETHD
jgi:alkylhydroperoxidase family enzyme